MQTNVVGCDSTVRLHVRIRNSSPVTNISDTACDSYTWNGTTYTSSGIKTQHYTNTQGCDSTVNLILQINSSLSQDIYDTVCNSKTWQGAVYTNTGNYQWNGTNVNGCPWTKMLHLIVNYSSTLDTTVDNCGSVTFRGITYNTSDNHIITLSDSNAVQCDSIINLHVRVRAVGPDTTVDTSACDSFYYAGFGQLYDTTTTESRTYKNIHGCDSVVTLNLTIKYSTNTLEDTAACDSYSWNEQTYTESGTYRLYGTNTDGCDSNQTLVLTIRHPIYTVSRVAECKSYTWYGTEYTESDTIIHVDSTINAPCVNADTLYLTIYGVEIPAEKPLVCKGNHASPWMLIYPRNPSESEHHYRWYRNGERIEGANKQYYVLPNEDVPQGVVYTVRVSDMEVQLCASESSVTLYHSGNDAANTMAVYPNPSRGHFSLQLTGEETEGVAQVLTQAGVEVMRFEVRDGWASVENSLPAGSYMLQVTTTKGKKMTERLVVY